MTTQDGDDDLLDTGALSQMRQLWRDLPDEEPPARGLDALMAAARSKAVEMAPAPAPEPWWRRTLALLARPPVLAAATVVVLVGSAALLSRHDSLAPATTTTTTASPESARAHPTSPVEKLKQEREPTVEATAGAGQGQATPTRPRPRPPSVPSTQPAAKPAVDPAPAGLEIADEAPLDSDDVKTGNALEPAKLAPGVKAPVTATAEIARLEEPQQLDQLVKAVEAAARRDDCASVRVTAARIRALDVRAYQTRVASQPAIKRCL